MVGRANSPGVPGGPCPVVLGIGVDDFEHAFEAFFNVKLTPAVHLNANEQFIDTPDPSHDDAYTIGERLQVDFCGF